MARAIRSCGHPCRIVQEKAGGAHAAVVTAVAKAAYLPELAAAHERTDIDINKQMKKHDDEIMDDDDF